MRCFLPVALSALSLRSQDSTRGDLAKVVPNGYNHVGCFDTGSVLSKVQYEGARPVTPETCATFCSDKAGSQSPLTKAVDSLQYFAVEGDTSGSRSRTCWCAVGYTGSKVDGCGPCQQVGVEGEENCGGEGKADVFLLHHCAQGSDDEKTVKAETRLKKVAAEQEKRKLFNVFREGRACGEMHNVAVDGKTTLVGSLDECKLACGSEKRCAMFTYDDSMKRCLFTDDTDESAKEDSGLTCYIKSFGKGPVTVRELVGPSEDIPDKVKEKQQSALRWQFAGDFEKEPPCPDTCLGGEANIRASMCENAACLTCPENLRSANCEPMTCPKTCFGTHGNVKIASCDDWFCKTEACEPIRKVHCNK